ncbi:MAG: MurR/RpiR family transcriptional regulator [Lactovum sp.]
MFETESIKRLNELELLAFEYMNCEPEEVCQMTIRDFAQKIHCSTTTIVRLANKLGFKGWAELKYFLKSRESLPNLVDHSYENMIALDMFWKQLSEVDFQKKKNQAVEEILKAKMLIFIGLGTSDALAQYGVRYFSNLGVPSYAFGDIFRPVTDHEFENTVVIALSVSGETKQMLDKIIEIQRAGALLISITNNECSTLSKMAKLNFSYQMLNSYAGPKQDIKLTTQLPALAILEILAYQSGKRGQRQIII